MALTEKGCGALQHIKRHFPTGAFSAKDLSDACGEKIVAATLNAVANNGYLVKLGGSPVRYEAVNELRELPDATILIWQQRREQRMTSFILDMKTSKLRL